jgi:hypothetical protein
VQLYTLELANALSQNCGPEMYRELASRSFTDSLSRLAGDRVGGVPLSLWSCVVGLLSLGVCVEYASNCQGEDSGKNGGVV